MALRFRERVITITPPIYKAEQINVRKVKISVPKETFNEKKATTAILKVKPEDANQEIQRIVTKKQTGLHKVQWRLV
jgi:hypothetical protein